MDLPHEHDVKEKAKARKSGPSLLKKTRDLGTLAHIFAVTIYWDPTHQCHRVMVHLPEGQIVPDVNSLIADELAGKITQQPRKQSRRQAQSVHDRRRQQPLRRSARRRGQRSSRRSSYNTTADPYAFMDTSEDEALSDGGTRSKAAGSRRGSGSSSMGVEASRRQRGLSNAPGNGNGRGSAPTVTSNHSDQPSQSDERMVENASQAEDGMSWTRDTSWAEIDTSFLDDMIGDNFQEGNQSMGEGQQSRQTESIGVSRKKTAPARPVPGTAWRRLARDSLKLLDGILSPKPVRSCLPWCANIRSFGGMLDRRYVY